MPRPSPVRDALSKVLSGGDRHDWSIEDLQTALRAHGVAADFSSVFRAVGRLEADGAVERVDLGDGKARYEAAGEHHEHVRCERCGAIGVVGNCVVDEAVPQIEETTGFRVTGHQLVFSGVCPRCLEDER